jgi:hypothetical protein
MDRYNDNKATPTKRTGVKNDNNSPDPGNGNDNNTIQIIAPEIAQPNPTSATPTIPSEIPERNIK